MQDMVMADPGAYSDMWPMIAISSAIYPAFLLRGKLQGRLEFPAFLGAVSKAQANRRRLMQLTKRLCAVTPCAGVAVLHTHGDRCLLHAGAKVTCGTKFLLRTDIVYDDDMTIPSSK